MTGASILCSSPKVIEIPHVPSRLLVHSLIIVVFNLGCAWDSCLAPIQTNLIRSPGWSVGTCVLEKLPPPTNDCDVQRGLPALSSLHHPTSCCLSSSVLCFSFLFFFFLAVFWVFSVRGLSLVAASGDHSSSRCAGLSLWRPLLLRSTGSRRAGSVVVAHGPSCSVACGIFPDQGSNPCPLHWQADSQPLHHQGSPPMLFWVEKNIVFWTTESFDNQLPVDSVTGNNFIIVFISLKISAAHTWLSKYLWYC